MPEDYADYKIGDYYIVFLSYLFVMGELVEDREVQQYGGSAIDFFLAVFSLRVDDYEWKGVGYA